jgi:hypothetical protein
MLAACASGTTPPARGPSDTPTAEELIPLSAIKHDIDERNKDLAWMGAHPLYVVASPTVRYFVAPTRCGQGPFEIHFPVAPTAWVEIWDSYALSPRALRGRTAEQSPRFGGTNFFGDGANSKGPPDNAACVLNAAERSASEREAVARGAASGAVPAGAPPAPGAAPLGAGSAPGIAPREIQPPHDLPRARKYNFGGGSMARRGKEPMWTTGASEVVIRFWFDEPNDLDGVVFVVEHATAALTISGDEYLARIAARERELRAKADEDERALDASRAANAARQDFCDQHHDDRGCWPAGYEETMARRAEARRQLDEESRRAAEAYAHRPLPPKEPEQPPPPARAETPPPRPSTHATWIAGYWDWLDERWLWLDGRWRVPEEDVARDLTVHAPAPPPAPRTEAPPPPPPAPRAVAAPAPHPALVWTPGYWQWDGGRWLWIAGAWRRPPSPSATWIPDRWRARAGGAVFLPGGWSVELRLPR